MAVEIGSGPSSQGERGVLLNDNPDISSSS